MLINHMRNRRTPMRAIDFVESYFDAWNHRDAKAVADHLDVDGFYLDVPENVQRSHDELIVELNDFFSSFRHRYELIGDILSSRHTIAFQYRMCPPPDAGKAGNEQPIYGAEFITLNGDAALTITDYCNIDRTNSPSGLNELTTVSSESAKYAKSGLSCEQLTEYKDRLDRIMKSEQAYLRSDLTLPRLAETIQCSVNHLSQVINSGFGMSFFDYVNRFRINHAKCLLASHAYQNGAVLNIAFNVGFNSNSAFYAAFKKFVGQTPAQFRRSQLQKPH